MAFTGFPMGTILDLYSVTHQGIVSAITPIAIPMHSSVELNVAIIRRLKSLYEVFQLDVIAYPGD